MGSKLCKKEKDSEQEIRVASSHPVQLGIARELQMGMQPGIA